MSLKNETREAFQYTKSFYRDYTDGMTRKRMGREFQADSDRLRALYREAIGANRTDIDPRKIPIHIKATRLFEALSERLKPTRRLVFGGAIAGFILHYFTTGFFSAILMPVSFTAVILILMVELLEKLDVKREIDLAREIQLSLLPPSQIKHDKLEIASFATTAREVGGDYVDVIETPKGVYLIIADVSGKGLSAALYMVRIQAMVRLLIRQSQPTPKELFLEMNNYIKSGKKDKTFVTACAAFFPKDENSFQFCRAGHNSPILFRDEKDATLTLRTPGLALGICENDVLGKHLQQTTVTFNPGDSLLLYTDGLTEARDISGREFGLSRLQSIVEIYGAIAANTLVNKIQYSLETFIDEEPQLDDITFTAIHYNK
ncbi:MAG TPA: PP2C family protein-serine/threonine phosphatase [Balneolales bacterium]|nr:PP2C family protein-serine/threonine phosphatase [Balneolales bacterium]